jgi:DNA-directed RNA polymerase subunit M/transcription elongation factor TFIIS
MEITLRKKINANTQIDIKVAGELKDCLFQLQPLMNAPSKCPSCESDKITITTRVAKKEGDVYQYIQYTCTECGQRQKWGEYKAPKGCFFLSDTWDPPYKGQQNKEE